MAFTVAIIGRPNVGKSTLFNKLVGKQFAIVDDISGVTRDRKEAMAKLGPMEFKVVDTAGLENELSDKQLEIRMVKQTEEATMDADLCLFVVDGKAGVVPADIHFAKWLIRSERPAVLVVNKRENNEGEVFDKEYYRLGLGQGVAVSAEHKGGFNLLYDLIEPYFDKYQKDFGVYEEEKKNDKDKYIQIAIVGRPNSGKSTFLNKLVGEERLITGAEAGITRDAIAIDWQYEDYQIRLIDTAGIRKKSNITAKLEQLSSLDSFRAIRYAQIVIMLVDVNLAMDHQDLAIMSMVMKEGRGLVFAINKFDLIKNREDTLREIREKLAEKIPSIARVPVIPVSALNGHNVEKTITEAIRVYEQWQSYIPTAKLNEWLKFAENAHAPVMVRGTPVKLKYMTQAKKRPPTFILFTNHPKALKGAYERYLLNSIREYFDLKLIPLRLIIKKSENPFKDVKYKQFSKKTKENDRKGWRKDH